MPSKPKPVDATAAIARGQDVRKYVSQQPQQNKKPR